MRSESEEIPKSVSESIFCRFGVSQKDHFGKRAPRRDETLVFGGRGPDADAVDGSADAVAGEAGGRGWSQWGGRGGFNSELYRFLLS